jgi:hypothetical protein
VLFPSCFFCSFFLVSGWAFILAKVENGIMQ